MTQTCFHDVTIGALQFQGVLGADGPAPLRGDTEGVALGRATSIRYVGERMEVASRIHAADGVLSGETLEGAGPKAWWVVKYQTQRRIDLSHLSDAQRSQLATEFGIEIEGENDGQRAAMFFASPAYQGLGRWVREHPKRARELSRYQNYIAGWYDKALAGEERCRGGAPSGITQRHRGITPWKEAARLMLKANRCGP